MRLSYPLLAAVAPTCGMCLMVQSSSPMLRSAPVARRAAAVVACDYQDGDVEEYEDALNRYTAWGLFDGDGAPDEEEDDDETTTEQMMELSKQRLDAVASPRRSADSSMTATGTSAFTVDNVDTVLDQVRPYLISDGGNVAVISVDEASKGVKLHLQGACGSCPSSTVTMKMGIERVLREAWPDLGAVTQADDEEVAEMSDDEGLTAAVVEVSREARTRESRRWCARARELFPPKADE